MSSGGAIPFEPMLGNIEGVNGVLIAKLGPIYLDIVLPLLRPPASHLIRLSLHPHLRHRHCNRYSLTASLGVQHLSDVTDCIIWSTLEV